MRQIEFHVACTVTHLWKLFERVLKLKKYSSTLHWSDTCSIYMYIKFAWRDTLGYLFIEVAEFCSHCSFILQWWRVLMQLLYNLHWSNGFYPLGSECKVVILLRATSDHLFPHFNVGELVASRFASYVRSLLRELRVIGFNVYPSLARRECEKTAPYTAMQLLSHFYPK